MTHLDIARDTIANVSEGLLLPLLDILEYTDVKGDVDVSKPNANGSVKTWARLTTTFGVLPQRSLSAVNRKQRYTQTGVVKIQVFAPKGQGAVASNDIVVLWLAKLLRERLPSGFFKNARIIQVGEDGAWFNVNGSVEFEYVVEF